MQPPSVVEIGEFQYFPNRIIGKGTTGQVYLGQRIYDKMPVAIKTIQLVQINTDVKKHLLNCEISALTQIHNSYVCQAYSIMKDKQFYFIPMEHFPNGTLKDYIKSKKTLSIRETLHLFGKILEGYCGVVEAGFLHRDLKTENILLRANMDPVIIDFGYCEKAVTQSQRLTYNVGSPAYMSPEAYNSSFYSEKSDIWALGVILHEMLTGTIPIMRTSDVDEYFRYLQGMKTAEIIPGCSHPLCKQLLLSTLTVDASQRPDAYQLRQMIINNLHRDNVRNKAKSIDSKNKIEKTKTTETRFFQNSLFQFIKNKGINNILQPNKDTLKDKNEKNRRREQISGKTLQQNKHYVLPYQNRADI